MENTKISIELEEWQVKALRNYFGKNDKTQVAHWAFKEFDNAFKNKTNDQTTQLREENKRLKGGDNELKLLLQLILSDNYDFDENYEIRPEYRDKAEQLLKEQ